MNNEEKILSLMEKMYMEFTDRFEKNDERMSSIEGIVARIENEHGKKLSALFDGYVQNTSKLDRIEKEVTKHEKFILERIK